ncbi:1622_t:CDS:1, partial [Racocetra persica]
KKNSTSTENNENYKNLHILDLFVQKRRGCLLTKHIKSSTENKSQHISTRNSTINSTDPNLYKRQKTLLNILNNNANIIDNIFIKATHDMKEHVTK